MSTSPDTQKGKKFIEQAFRFGYSPGDAIKNPGLILLKGLLGLALIVGVLVAIGMNYATVWDFIVATLIPGFQAVLEFAESVLDSFYILVGVSGAIAPLATAYTGFVVFLGIVYVAGRKGYKLYKKAQLKKQELVDVYSTAWRQWSGTVKEKATEKWTIWWSSLDAVNKVVAVVFMVLIGIPIALLLSFILGSLVANLM